MRQVMAAAEVGDDVFNDDPTVIKLEQKVAQILGKEAALYVPSGTMANQISLRVLCNPGDEVICERKPISYSTRWPRRLLYQGLCFGQLMAKTENYQRNRYMMLIITRISIDPIAAL